MFEQGKPKDLENHRKDALLKIRWEQKVVELMVQRARIAGDAPDVISKPVLERIAQLEQEARQATDIDELDDLVVAAARQGQLRAYVCPLSEIASEGNLKIDVMAEWGVPKQAIAKLRESLDQTLKAGSPAARGALRALFEEYDSWESYSDDYEDEMQTSTYWLFAATIILPVLALVAFHFPRTFLGGFLLAGAAGSCVSVMAKMPVLDVRPSGELDSYVRRTLSRIGVGIVASLIGSALLGWGLLPISIQNLSFADVLNTCAASPATTCSGLRILILLGIPMLFGFSERGLTSFELKVFGNSERRRGARSAQRRAEGA